MIKNLKLFICMFAILFSIIGCKTNNENEKVDSKTVIQMLPTAAEIAQLNSISSNTAAMNADWELAKLHSEYKLSPGDIIELYSVDTPEVSRKYVIGPDGMITVPGIGVISIENMTRGEAGTAISVKLSSDYRNPNIDVIVSEYNGNEIYVLGALTRTGIFSFKGRPTLLAAIARAEGFQSDADLRSCQVLRGRGTLINIDLYKLLDGDKRMNIPLMPGDTVFVRRNQENTFYLMGEVNQTGVYDVGNSMNLVRALALGEGYTNDANLEKVTVIRDYLGENPEMYTIDIRDLMRGEAVEGDLSVNAGDFIYVPKRGLAKVNYVLTQLSPTFNWIVFYDFARSL
jgi:polysaccharide export outer membrane protein